MQQVYLNEYGIPADNNAIFYPYTSGLIQAYARQFDVINQNYEFKPILFIRDTVDNIVNKYDDPSIVGFSTTLWNYRLSLAVAKRLKQKFKECLIIFGGPQVEIESKQFFNDYPFVDLCVYGEGEKVFKDILVENLQSRISHYQTLHLFELDTDLDIFPSPYQVDIFDNYKELYPQITFKGLVELNRNCPFHCAYCCWGQKELGSKVKYHSYKYVKRDAEWFGQNQIEYLFCTDGNFGMFERDIKSAQIYADVKEKYSGYPSIFRVCFGKNITNNIFKTVKILTKSGLAKSVSLSVQSQDELVLKSINRKNISQKVFLDLQHKYIDLGVSTYTEIILGLPNETKQSFLDGLEKTLRTIDNNQLFVYHCQVLKNTALDSQEYRNKYGLQTVNRILKEPHSETRHKDIIKEYEEVIIGTNTLSIEEWKECAVISWTIQLLHSLKIADKLIKWMVQYYQISYMSIYNHIINSGLLEIKKFCEITDEIIAGGSESQSDIRFGQLNYEPEEMAYLNILCNKGRFYFKFYAVLIDFLFVNGLEYCLLIEKLMNQQRESPLPSPNDFDTLQDFAIKTIIYGGKDV